MIRIISLFTKKEEEKDFLTRSTENVKIEPVKWKVSKFRVTNFIEYYGGNLLRNPSFIKDLM